MRRAMSERDKVMAERLANEVARELQLAIPLSRKNLKRVRLELEGGQGAAPRAGWEEKEYRWARSIVLSPDSTLYPMPVWEKFFRNCFSADFIEMLACMLVWPLLIWWALDLPALSLLTAFVLVFGAFFVRALFSCMLCLLVLAVLSVATGIGVKIAFGIFIFWVNPLIYGFVSWVSLGLVRAIGKRVRLPAFLKKWAHPCGRPDSPSKEV